MVHKIMYNKNNIIVVQQYNMYTINYVEVLACWLIINVQTSECWG